MAIPYGIKPAGKSGGFPRQCAHWLGMTCDVFVSGGLAFDSVADIRQLNQLLNLLPRFLISVGFCLASLYEGGGSAITDSEGVS